MTKNKFQTKADSAIAHNFMQSILPQGTQKKNFANVANRKYSMNKLSVFTRRNSRSASDS